MASDVSGPNRGVGPLRVAVVGVAAALYVAACGLPATDIGSLDGGALSDGPVEHRPAAGWAHLAFGWLDLPRSLPAWSANFVLAAGMVWALHGRCGTAAALGGLAVLLGLTTLTSYRCEGVYAGFYLWQASQVVFAGGMLVLWAPPRLRGGAEPGATADSPRDRWLSKL